MNVLVTELKTRARVRLNALRRAAPETVAQAQALSAEMRWPFPVEWKLKHTLNLVSAEAGFRHWDHARRVLGGKSEAGDDMGTFWYATSCHLLLNHWFAQYDEAKIFHSREPEYYLLPYARQFVVADANYISMLRLAATDDLWQAADFDLVSAYGTPVWEKLSTARLAAIRA